MELSDLYSQVIQEHNRSHHNKRNLKNPTVTVPGKNPSCGDAIELSLKLQGGIIADAAYTGFGCAISEASASIMIDLIRGTEPDKTLSLSTLFLRMIRREALTGEELKLLGEAAALSGVAELPARVKCAALAWYTLEEALRITQM